MGKCGSCERPIVWMRTEPREGKPARNIPVDAAEASDEVVRPQVFADGNLELTGRQVDGRFGPIPEVRYVAPGKGAYRTHFSSCPHAETHRRRRQ